MHLQFFSSFYSGTLLTMALVIAHPPYPRTATLQTRDLIGGILGDSFESVIATPDVNTINNPQTTAIEGGGFPVQTPTLTGASRVSTSTTVSTAASSHTTPFVSQTTTERPTSETSSAVSSATSIQIGYVADAPVTPPGEATEWKVIGIAVIAITFIGIVILSITFFDSWWGFLRALFFGKKHNGGDEKLVPDWDKRSWEYNLANEDGHRYPTMASLESIVKIPEKVAGANLSPFITRLSQHDFFSHCLTESDPQPKEQLVRDASLRKAGIRS